MKIHFSDQKFKYDFAYCGSYLMDGDEITTKMENVTCKKCLKRLKFGHIIYKAGPEGTLTSGE